ncbi:MAG: DinB family protein [Bacteroidia bacterium]
MYRKTEDFLNEWKYESESTISTFKNISNEALNKKDHENVRSIARLAWHITLTIAEMMNKTGLNVSGPDEHSQPPSEINAIIREYERSAASVAEEVKNKWTDASLLEEKNLYGESWMNGLTLGVLVKHQTHHRGQLTVLMRQAGLKVPGIYGPAKEEWAAMNMASPD